MSKNVRIKESGSLGFDLNSVEIYHTSIDPANLITTVSASALTGSGILLQNIPDNYVQFFAKASDGVCLGTTSSINTIGKANENTRWFTIYSSSSLSTVELIHPTTIAATTSSFEYRNNFNENSFIIIQASPVYPETAFDGWYNSETGGDLLSSDVEYTIYSGSHTGSNDIWGRFS